MKTSLYFEPADYGKGMKKKSKQQTAQDEESSKRKWNLGRLFGVAIVLAIIILIILWLLRGKETTSGQFPENVRNESLTCLSNEKIYPKLNMINSENHELKINAIFRGSENLKSLSLVYTTHHANEEESYRAEAISHAEFNDGLSSKGYSATKFNNKFARYDNMLIVSVTAIPSLLDEFSAEYFMINLDENGKINLTTISDYKTNYESQGFTCETTLEE